MPYFFLKKGKEIAGRDERGIKNEVTDERGSRCPFYVQKQESFFQTRLILQGQKESGVVVLLLSQRLN